MTIEAVHIVVRGRVQGVWYRASAKARASELKLAGWARNCPDGTVEIHAEGDRQNLDQFIEWCRKGPSAAEVTGLDTTPVSTNGMETFLIR
jgi:acylphosphatase